MTQLDGAAAALEDGRYSNSERVYRALREQIFSGELPPGSRLVELQLASRYQTSRTPVREALKRLTAEGFVAVDPVRGMVVRDMDPAQIEEIYEVREVLEGLAARLAARRASEADLAKLNLLMEMMEESSRTRRWQAVVQVNMKFHEVIYLTSGNHRLYETAHALQEFVERFSSVAFTKPERLTMVLAEHRELVAAIASRDEARAEAVARQHLVAARKNLAAHHVETAQSRA